MIGIRNSTALPVIVKKNLNAYHYFYLHLVRKYHPRISKSLEEQLKISSVDCTMLKTKFNTYASFQISINEEDFPSVNKAQGYGQLGVSPFKPWQMESPDALTIQETTKHTGDTMFANNSNTASAGRFHSSS
jgi:hypothetical protein